MTEQPATPRKTRSRRWLLTRGSLIAATVAVPSAWAAHSATADEVQALATVDMEMVLVAAQVDPRKSGTGITPGAGPSVKLVEQALQAKGLLNSAQVDGHFGTSTISAYSALQRSLGYSGLDANGMPGKTSLTNLGSGRYTVSRPISPGSRTDSYSGKRTNTRTVRMLAAADARLSTSIRLTQGSYTSSNPGSAGTHDGGGVVDISVSGLSTTQRWQMVRELRRVGFAAWLRTPAQGFDYHIHAVAVADPDLASAAQPQVHDYYFGKNGLASHAADNTPEAYRLPFTWWEKYNRG
ncbi:peptidoglycan-binding domain-containing protein [Stackebrandtia soli]|uniref:peptidoglycan-binding domain-containing protein n=1 Tax=Stackebrandtia soli TaxID=1892856 RepID=UPI0039E9474C